MVKPVKLTSDTHGDKFLFRGITIEGDLIKYEIRRKGVRAYRWRSRGLSWFCNTVARKYIVSKEAEERFKKLGIWDEIVLQRMK